jgi:hypothetical protein
MITSGSMLTGAIILLVGVVIGALIGRMAWPARGMAPKPGEPKPVCGCKHHYSMHDQSGRCHEQEWRYSKGEGEHWVDCACQRYTGPEPLPEFVA